MSHGRGLEAYERAVNDLLDALAGMGNPQASEDQKKAARQAAVEAALSARYAALAVDEEEAEIDLWVPPHLRPREESRNYRLPVPPRATELRSDEIPLPSRDVT